MEFCVLTFPAWWHNSLLQRCQQFFFQADKSNKSNAAESGVICAPKVKHVGRWPVIIEALLRLPGKTLGDSDTLSDWKIMSPECTLYKREQFLRTWQQLDRVLKQTTTLCFDFYEFILYSVVRSKERLNSNYFFRCYRTTILRKTYHL
jgi:hypothetical protein